jgi:hypothetical protein
MAIAAKDLNHNPQYPLHVSQPLDHTQISDGEVVNAVHLPPAARVVGGGIYVKTPFNISDAAEADVGDAGDPNRYSATPVDLTTAGFTPFDITGYGAPTPLWLSLTIDAAGNAGDGDAGEAIVMVQYVIDGRGSEVVPFYDPAT